MNNDLTWRFDVTVIEWLILLTILIILSVVGAVVTRRSLGALKKLNGQSSTPVLPSESWHTESAKTVFESLDTTADGLSKEDANIRLAKHAPNLDRTSHAAPEM